MLAFSNPRLLAEFDDWPSGRERVKCKFVVEAHPKRGERAVRTTTKNGQWCKPKADTYADAVAIVDGDDGRTYVLRYHKTYGAAIDIRDHAFMSAQPEHYVTLSDHPERFLELKALIEAAHIPQPAAPQGWATVGTDCPND